MTLELPVPPSANRYWRKWRNRMVVSDEARAYKTFARLKALALGCRPLEGAVRLEMKVYRPRKKGDLGNSYKVLEDALQGALYSDDKQITELHLWRFDDKHNPRVEVTVTQA